MANCGVHDRWHRWGGYVRKVDLTTGDVRFVRGCRRRACRAIETVKISAEQLRSPSWQDIAVPTGRRLVMTERTQQPYLAKA